MNKRIALLQKFSINRHLTEDDPAKTTKCWTRYWII